MTSYYVAEFGACLLMNLARKFKAGYSTIVKGSLCSTLTAARVLHHCKRIEVNQSWYRYVPQARERRAAKRHVVGFNECATLNKLQVTGLLIEINMLIIS